MWVGEPDYQVPHPIHSQEIEAGNMSQIALMIVMMMISIKNHVMEVMTVKIIVMAMMKTMKIAMAASFNH